MSSSTAWTSERPVDEYAETRVEVCVSCEEMDNGVVLRIGIGL